MQPRQYKLLSEILLVIGSIVVISGACVLYFLSETMTGALLLIIGCGLVLISLPTFMILTLLAGARIIK
ncbi:MAG: hypothetical protein E7Z64_00995 [Thermoplasmata archaeon]|nr:hypothetical protein [Thermoplasmata archaeon]